MQSEKLFGMALGINKQCFISKIEFRDNEKNKREISVYY